MSVTSPFGTIGCRLEEIDTPALLVDVAALERNIQRMAEFGNRCGINIRPHAKAHKSPFIAHMQIKAGAIGVCCQKVGEAEVMVAGGVDDILISNEVVTRAKLTRLVSLARHARITVAVDSIHGARAASRAAEAAGVELGAVIDLDVGQGRCGIAPGGPALELARAMKGLPNLALRGLQGYQGRLQHVAGYAQRAKAAASDNAKLIETRKLFEKDGLSVELVSGAGTGTYAFEGPVRGMTEIQPGSYIFMDRQYREIGGRDGAVYDDFEPSLSVLATVISRPSDTRVVLDAGLKALSDDAGPAAVLDQPGWIYDIGGDEHGILRRVESVAAELNIGDVVRVMPSHCDTTVNLHDHYCFTRDGRLELVVPIAARGRIR